MKKNYDIIFDKKKLTSEEIEKFKDFGALLKKFKSIEKQKNKDISKSDKLANES